MAEEWGPPEKQGIVEAGGGRGRPLAVLPLPPPTAFPMSPWPWLSEGVRMDSLSVLVAKLFKAWCSV